MLKRNLQERPIQLTRSLRDFSLSLIFFFIVFFFFLRALCKIFFFSFFGPAIYDIAWLLFFDADAFWLLGCCVFRLYICICMLTSLAPARSSHLFSPFVNSAYTISSSCPLLPLFPSRSSSNPFTPLFCLTDSFISIICLNTSIYICIPLLFCFILFCFVSHSSLSLSLGNCSFS